MVASEQAVSGSAPRGGRGQVVAALLDADRDRPGAGLTAGQLAYRLDLHVTTVRFHLERLVDAGRLTTYEVRGGGAGRPATAYALVTDSPGEPREVADRAAPTPYELLAGLLVQALATRGRGAAGGSEPAAAGRRWATDRLGGSPVSWPEAVAQVRSLLGEWGYAVGPDHGPPAAGSAAGVPSAEFPPDAAFPPDVVEFTVGSCPFEDLARVHPQVVCAVHRGLMEGALDGLRQGPVDVELEPFVTPTACRVRLAHGGSD